MDRNRPSLLITLADRSGAREDPQVAPTGQLMRLAYPLQGSQIALIEAAWSVCTRACMKKQEHRSNKSGV